MVFSTIIFLFRFLPITLALYYLAPAKLKNTVLFLCSLVFYCWGEVRFFPVMVALILINYLSGLAIEHFDAKPALRRFFLLIARILHHLRVITYLIYRNRHQIIRRSTEFTNVTCHLCILEEVLIFGSFHI